MLSRSARTVRGWRISRGFICRTSCAERVPGAPGAPGAPGGPPAGAGGDAVPEPPAPPAGCSLGTVPSSVGERLDMCVRLSLIGTGANCGSAGVFQDQYLRPSPRSRSVSCLCDSARASSGGAAVTVRASTPPATSLVPLTPTVVSSLMTPTKCVRWNL